MPKAEKTVGRSQQSGTGSVTGKGAGKGMKCCTQKFSRQTALYGGTTGFSGVTWLPGETLSKHRVYSRKFSEAQEDSGELG